MNSVPGRLKSERGAELIEMALILPLLLLVLLGIIDFGFLFQRYEVLTNAAREGARIAVLPGYAAADVNDRICKYLISGGVPVSGNCATGTGNPLITVSAPTALAVGASTINVIEVDVAYSHNFMFVGGIIGMMGGTWTSAKTINIEAVMRVEQ